MKKHLFYLTIAIACAMNPAIAAGADTSPVTQVDKAPDTPPGDTLIQYIQESGAEHNLPQVVFYMKPPTSDVPGDPSSWRAYIVLRPNLDKKVLEGEAFVKKVARQDTLMLRKVQRRDRIIDQYNSQRITALDKLRKEDSTAAVYWLESNSTQIAEHNLPAVPTSPAFMSFVKTMNTIADQENATCSKLDAEFDAVEMLAERMYTAEMKKIQVITGDITPELKTKLLQTAL